MDIQLTKRLMDISPVLELFVYVDQGRILSNRIKAPNGFSFSNFQIGLKPAIFQLHAWNFVTSSRAKPPCSSQDFNNLKYIAAMLQVLDQFELF